jgi:glyoxylase-like metal-dependent hydrolase (beta-lactamase superfamily II)
MLDKDTAPKPGHWIPRALWDRQAPPAQEIRDHTASIQNGAPLEIAEDVFLLRLPLPFALNHINVYLLRDGAGWTLVDCGLDTLPSRRIWMNLLATPRFKSRPIARIIVTHHHPDHIGLAGWLSAQLAAPIFMTPGEYAVAGRYADPKRDIVAERVPFWCEHGISRELALELLGRMPRYAVQVHPLHGNVRLLDGQTPITIGARRWRPIIGRGHSPEHLSLLDEAGQLLLGGDQVLPIITPNIAVWPDGDRNPLRSYIESLDAFARIGGDTLLLPSHKQPLYGIAARVHDIRVHHEERLDALWKACDRPQTAFELLPALFGRPLRNEELGFGLGEAVSHLNFLQSTGALVSSLDASGQRRFEVK